MDGTHSCKENKTHAGTPSCFDQICTDGKLLNDIDAVLRLLLRGGVIGKILSSVLRTYNVVILSKYALHILNLVMLI